MKVLIVVLVALFISGCSVFGDNGVESAPYIVIHSDDAKQIDVRNYESMILVSASSKDGDNRAFRKLFKYIAGENKGTQEIAMTAPVFIDGNDQGREIAMTAPVFMSDSVDEPSMSFVMPSDFTLATTPEPLDASVTISEVKNYKVAAIKFSGTLRRGNVEEHTRILRNWLDSNGYEQIGAPVKAGYNGPLTIPFLRHNEVLIEIK